MAAAETGPAKDRFSSLDTLAVVHEIRAAGRLFVDKVFDAGPDLWEVTLRSPATGKWSLLLGAGRFAALLRSGPARSDALGPVARQLRRLLDGAALVGVAEPNGERFLDLELRRGDVEEPLRLVVEFFSPGNLLLVRGDRIVAVAHARSWAHRTVRIGAEYRPPPSRGDPWAIAPTALRAALERSRGDRVRTLAAPLGFGGPVAEELLARAGIAPSAPAPLEAGSVAERVRVAIAELLAELGEHPHGYLYRHGELPVDVEPFDARRWRAEGGPAPEVFATFSEAAYAYFSSQLPPVRDAREERTRGLERQADQQRTAGAALDEEIAAKRREAEAILAHYPEAERALEAADAEVRLTLGDVPVTLARGRSPREAAQSLFEETKRLQTKRVATREALRATEAKIVEVGAEAPPRRTGAAPGAPARHKPFWFERYRWFLSSDGTVVVGGRDAASNDLVVRRYLGAQDRYVHADVHGAASVVAKADAAGSPPTETTLREAAQWAAVHSRAWRAGHAAADAYWVEPDQVSKGAASGEFVARGAWVVHGLRHWLRDLPLELALGTVEYEGATLWTAAPPSALAVRGNEQLRLTPGDERRRAEVERQIVEATGIEPDRLEQLLPAGGIAVVREAGRGREPPDRAH